MNAPLNLGHSYLSKSSLLPSFLNFSTRFGQLVKSQNGFTSRLSVPTQTFPTMIYIGIKDSISVTCYDYLDLQKTNPQPLFSCIEAKSLIFYDNINEANSAYLIHKHNGTCRHQGTAHQPINSSQTSLKIRWEEVKPLQHYILLVACNQMDRL